jgi:hypothetical protein
MLFASRCYFILVVVLQREGEHSSMNFYPSK